MNRIRSNLGIIFYKSIFTRLKPTELWSRAWRCHGSLEGGWDWLSHPRKVETYESSYAQQHPAAKHSLVGSFILKWFHPKWTLAEAIWSASWQVLRGKFRRVFYVPGNRDLALNASEAGGLGCDSTRNSWNYCKIMSDWYIRYIRLKW
jgi:hypothetical protein